MKDWPLELFESTMKSKISKEKLIIIITVFIDVLGMGIVIPVMPYYVQAHGLSPLGITFLFSVFSLFSFFSSPLIGALSDRFGRRPALIVSIASTSLGWFVFAAAKNPLFLFLGRIIDGMAAGNFPVAQSYLVDIAKNPQERTRNLGLTAAIFGIGFIIAPSLGAALSVISLSAPFWVVGVMALLNTIGAYIFLPETNHNRKTGPIDKKILNPLNPLKKAFSDKVLRSHYGAWFLFGFAIAAMQSLFALYLDQQFGFDAKAAGMVFAGMGMLMAVNQIFGLKLFWLKKFQESQLEKWMFLLLALGISLLAFKNLNLVFLGLFINAASQSVLRVVMSSRVAGFAGESRRGEVLGVMSSVMFLSMIFGPILAGWLFEKNTSWPFLAGGISLVLGFFVMTRCCKNLPEHQIKDEVIV